MTNSNYKFSLDVHDHGSHVSLKAKKGDTGRTLYITLMDGGRPYVITEDCRAVFTAKKADGKIIFQDCTITKNTISYVFTPQTTSAVGRTDCEIRLYGADDKLLTSASFTLLVDDSVYNDGDIIESVSEVTGLNKLLLEATTLVNDIKNKLANGEFNGAQGTSGVLAPTSGFFALEVDSATGDLYCVTVDGETVPTFIIDENGDLYYEIKEG